MIEFRGHMDGAALKYFLKRSRVLGQKMVLITWALLCPPAVLLTLKIGKWIVLAAYLLIGVCVWLLCYIPQSKKTIRATIPKRIFTDGESIVCVADKYTESKLIADVKLVREFEEFYELVFPFGNVSDKFICQKGLMVEGTAEQFEHLFQGKLVRKTRDGSKRQGDGSVVS